jgi:hypothetical protein
MGLSCLFGHDFGHPAHEEERERHGEEVVVTTRNVKTCRRCGSEQIVTENTAVVKREAVQSELDTGEQRAEPTTEIEDRETTTEPTTAAGTYTTNGPNTTPSTDQSGGFTSDAQSGDPEITDDAVILTDGSTEERHPMEWPDFRLTEESAERPTTTDGESYSRDDAGRSGDRLDMGRELTELHCERCETVYNPTGSSVRAGDLCPRCRSAYLADDSQ